MHVRMIGNECCCCRQDDQALESVGERQAGGGVQPERGQRTAQGPQLHQYSACPRPEADGVDGRGFTQADLRQRTHLPHQLHLGQFRRGDILVRR